MAMAFTEPSPPRCLVAGGDNVLNEAGQKYVGFGVMKRES